MTKVYGSYFKICEKNRCKDACGNFGKITIDLSVQGTEKKPSGSIPSGAEYGLPVHGGVYRLLASCNRHCPGVAQYLLCTPGVPLFAADAMRIGLLQLRVNDQPELSIKGVLS